jgi:hypothetical protein
MREPIVLPNLLMNNNTDENKTSTVFVTQKWYSGVLRVCAFNLVREGKQR